MTEREWLDSANPSAMLAWLNERDASARKFRLFTCAAARSLSGLMTGNLAQDTVLIAERFADGEITDKERRAGAEALRATYPPRMTPDNPVSISYCAGMVAYMCAWSNWVASPGPGVHLNVHGADSVVQWVQFTLVLAETGAWDQGVDHPIRIAEAKHQCRLLRDVFGNPFRPIQLDPSWRTSVTVGVAKAIYASRKFEMMQALGDALEDAGCSEDAVLTHCRQPETHVRGCWVVDSVLGK